MSLTSADHSKLDSGEMITKQTKDASGASGRAIAIQNVHAPPNLIWKQLLDFNAYPKKVDKLTECGIYSEAKKGVDGSKQIKARFLVKAAPGFGFEYYCDHHYSASKKSLTWTLDYSRDNDFDDVAGHWYVAQHPSKPDWSTLYYSADLALKGYVPGFVMNILTSTALKSAVGWVKKYSEADFAANGNKASGAFAGKFGGGAFKGMIGKSKAELLPPPPPPPRLPFYRRPRVLVAASMAGATAAASVVVAQHFAQPSSNE